MDAKSFQRMDSHLAGWSDPVARLRQAIQKNEFELYCQPIAALGPAGGYAMGEVLVRMREEERALLPPGEFLPVMEHFRMMPQLDRWVVAHAVRSMAAGLRLPLLTINLSAQTLEDAEFVPYVAAQLAASRLGATALAFEIDEADAINRPQAALQFAAAYQALGGRILIDGFGRRAVTFAPLKALKPAYVKVDGSIVRKILTSEVARSKLGAILRVGEALGYAVIAECVEDQDVLLRLKALGVAYAQGFGIYQPHAIGSFALKA
jgi:EAL domain-containing protein (putative c-di-GMP-specific phosphodiesterase class I)